MKSEKSGKSKQSGFVTCLLVALLIIGLGLILYPSVSDYYNSFHQTMAISNYESSLSNMNGEDYSELLDAAREYNAVYSESKTLYQPDGERKELYESLLNVDGSGVMGHIEIPSIRVDLPIYHGTSESVLDFAVGHLEWSCLPVGGTNTHCILSGHRGLPSAKLFTNLDRLDIGDTFELYILNEVLTYSVDEITVLTPEEAAKSTIIPGGDYCTLLTCTPYGINTHRLLVRGQRIATKENLHVSSEATQIDQLIIASVIAIPLFLLLIIGTAIRYRVKRH